jgi:replication factor A1
MEIKDIQPNQGNIDVVLIIKEKSDVRDFEKFGKQGKVCNATAKDDSGEIKLTLWNEDTDKVNAGDKIHLKNGWCSEYQGERQLSSGKFGEIEVLESNNEPKQEVKEETEKPKEVPTTNTLVDEEPVVEEEVIE